MEARSRKKSVLIGILKAVVFVALLLLVCYLSITPRGGGERSLSGIVISIDGDWVTAEGNHVKVTYAHLIDNSPQPAQ